MSGCARACEPVRTCSCSASTSLIQPGRGEKAGGGNKRWVSVSALLHEGVGSWAALFWLPSVPVSYLCVRPRVCLFVFLCLATGHAEPVVTQLRHSGKTQACRALSCPSRLGVACQHFPHHAQGTRASNDWSRLHRLKWVATDWMGSIPGAFLIWPCRCSLQLPSVADWLFSAGGPFSSHFYLGVQWPHTSPTDLTD